MRFPAFLRPVLRFAYWFGGIPARWGNDTTIRTAPSSLAFFRVLFSDPLISLLRQYGENTGVFRPFLRVVLRVRDTIVPFLPFPLHGFPSPNPVGHPALVEVDLLGGVPAGPAHSGGDAIEA